MNQLSFSQWKEQNRGIEVEACPECEGTGTVECPECDWEDFRHMCLLCGNDCEIECWACDGEGDNLLFLYRKEVDRVTKLLANAEYRAMRIAF